MKVDMHLAGMNEMFRTLLDMNEKVGRKFIRRGVNRAALLLRDAIRNSAPVRSGALKRSIAVKRSAKVRPSRGGWVATAVVGPRRKWGKEWKGEFVQPSRYAHLVEFGHIQKGGGHVAPKPFIRPAVSSTKSQMLQVQAAELQAGLASLRR